MRVDVVGLGMLNSTPLKRKTELSKITIPPNTTTQKTINLQNFPTKLVLEQMPNIAFKSRLYGKDDLSEYNNYKGSTPPEIEVKKYIISRQVDEHIEREDFLSAIKGKVELAKICKSQGKNRDSFVLEQSIRRLYTELPKYQRNEAKNAIATYNKDMAKYIDEDIKR